MSAEGRTEMRQIAEQMLSAFLRWAEEHHGGAAVNVPLLSAVRDDFVRSAPFHRFIRQAHGRLLEAAAVELLRHKRKDPFQRLLTHPMAEAFESGALSRGILPNYFSFLHLVLGDSRETLTGRCLEILNELRAPDPLDFSWDGFYEDRRAKEILWFVLVRIAETFKRFEARRDWFIALMQNHPQAVSVGPSAFVPLHQSEEVAPFGIGEFRTMFSCLFEPLRRLPAAERADFQRSFGAPPEQLFAGLYTNLAN